MRLIALLAILSACGHGVAVEPLILGTQAFPPFHESRDGTPVGPGVDIVTAAADRAGLACEVRLLPWRRAQEMARDGRLHGLFLIGRNPEREDWLSYTVPILTTEYGLFARSDADWTYRDVEDLRGRTVAVYGPSNTATSLATLAEELDDAIDIDLRPDDVVGFRKLAADRVDAVYSNKSAGLALIRRLELSSLVYAGTHRPVRYYAALATEYVAEDRIAAFQEGMRAIIADGTVAAIIARHGLEDEVRVGAADE